MFNLQQKNLDTTSLKQVMDSRRLEQWPELPVPANRKLCFEIAAQLKPELVHPFRLRLVCNQLLKISLDPSMQELKAMAEGQLECLSEHLKPRLDRFLVDIRKGKFSRENFLSSIDFPLISNAELEDNLQDFLFGSKKISIFSSANTTPLDLSHPSGTLPFISTPLATLVTLLAELPDKPNGKLIDIGCGAGGTVITLSLLTDLKVHGIDIHGGHIQTCQSALRLCSLDYMSVKNEDALSYDYKDYNIFYIYSPFRDKARIKQLLTKINQVADKQSVQIWAPVLPLFDRELDKCKWLQCTYSTGDINIWSSFS